MYEITISVDSPEQIRVLTYLIATEYHDVATRIGKRIAYKQGFRSPHLSIHTNPITMYTGIADG